MKAGLNPIKLVEFPGENVTDFCLKIRYYCKRLGNFGYWDEKFLFKLSNILKYYTEDPFRIWALTNITKTIKYIEKRNFQNMTSIPEEHSIDYDSMLNGEFMNTI